MTEAVSFFHKMYLLKFIFLWFALPSAKPQLDLGISETAENPFVYFEENNYNYDNHTIVTEDGYELLLVRLYKQNATSATGPPILFVHGILASFYDFLVAGPGVGIGYRALEEGYDVFLLSCRGNTFSRKHVTLDPDLNANQFWNFSWNEMGVYDVPPTIDYILNITGYSQLSYVGHSQGCATYLAMTSSIPEYNDKINLAVLLAPATYVQHAQFIFQQLFQNNLELYEAIVEILNINEILPHNSVLNGRVLCAPNSPLYELCKTLLYESFGPSGQVNPPMVSAYFTNVPAGTAIKQFTHYYQIGHSGSFRRFDYGEAGNQVAYGQSTPTDYNLTAVTTPVAVYRGASDYIVSVIDSARLVSELPNVVQDVLITPLVTNHFDVVVGLYVTEFVNDPVVALLNSYNNL